MDQEYTFSLFPFFLFISQVFCKLISCLKVSVRFSKYAKENHTPRDCINKARKDVKKSLHKVVKEFLRQTVRPNVIQNIISQISPNICIKLKNYILNQLVARKQWITFKKGMHLIFPKEIHENIFFDRKKNDPIVHFWRIVL